MSWKPDKKSLKRPFYRSIALQLESDINSGSLLPGTKLPPQRELADFLDLNFTTITRAYKECELKGLIYAVTGRGTFVAANAARSITISRNPEKDMIDLGFAASFEETNNIVANTVQQVLSKPYLGKLLNYNDPSGMPHHKTAAQNWMENIGIHASTEHIAIVSGAQNALTIGLTALFEPGNRIATDTHTYSNFIELAKLLHIQLVPIDGDEDGMLPGELEKQCRQTNIHGIFLMPSCSNPTTTIMSHTRKVTLAEIIKKHRLILIEDDIHAFFTAGVIPDYKEPIYNLIPDQTLYICSTSKTICSGLRVAYIVFGEIMREKILRSVYNINVKTSSLDAEIITELIQSGTAAEIISRKKQLAQKANQIFDELIHTDTNNVHPLSFYRWMETQKSLEGYKLEADLKHKGVFVFHSDRFRIGQESEKKFLRIALSSASSFEELRTGLAIIKDYIEN